MALNQLTEQPPLQLRSGSGPRHGMFVETHWWHAFYVINQIANTLVRFNVSYLRNGSLAFKALAEMDLLVRMNGTRVD
jgi:6-phosphogluconolactonase (cycloisomerase 2 family)